MSARYFSFLIAATFAFAAPDGAALYKARCAACHDGAAQARMPSHAELAGKAPEAIVNALFQGAMRTQAAGLTAEEGAAIAKFLTGKEPGTSTEPTAGQCKTAGKPVTIGAGDWNEAIKVLTSAALRDDRSVFAGRVTRKRCGRRARLARAPERRRRRD